MAKELNIISEISRMREMMGFNDINYGTKKYIQESMYGRSKNILTEALTVKDDWISRIFKAITGDDNYSERFGKTIADQWDSEARGVADVLEREGLDDIGKLMDNIAIAKGIDVSAVRPDMIDDAMRLYFKNNPDIAEKILKSSADFVSSVLKGKDFITIVGASNKNLADDLTYVFSTPIIPADAFVLRNDLGAIATTFKNSGLDLNDPAVKEISDALDNLEKTADMMSDTSGKIPDASPDAAPIPKDALSSGKTKAELDAEAKAKSDEDAANKAKKDQEDAQRQSDENFEKMKNQSLEQSIDKLKADEYWSTAFSMWSKLFAYLNIGKIPNYLARAEKSLGSLQLYKFDDFINSDVWKKYQQELIDKSTARRTKKGQIKSSIDNARSIIKSLKKLWGEIPILGKVGKVVSSIAIVLIVIFLLDSLVVDFGDMAQKLGDWTWSISGGNALISDPNTNREYCLRQLEGYYDIPEEDRFKLLSIPLGCENANAENFDLYVSKIEYLKGGVGMDADGNKVTKKDRFKVTIGNQTKEFEVGSSSSGSTGTGKTKTENDGKAFINSMNGPGQDLEGLTLTKWDALGNENYSATLSNGQVVNIKWDGSSFVPQ